VPRGDVSSSDPDAPGLDTLSTHLFLRGAEMVTTRRSGPLDIARTIRNGVVEPAFGIVRLDDRVVITNQDNVPRRLFWFDGQTTRISNPIPPGASVSRPARRFGPITMATDVSGSPRSIAFVAENPFLATATPDGAFRMTGVPPGDYRVVAWAPAGYLRDWVVRVPFEGSVAAE
ncbi:MAG TPA: hypothetical protein VF720_09705, partial [Candidatus Eisenbacteria bacterium]